MPAMHDTRSASHAVLPGIHHFWLGDLALRVMAPEATQWAALQENRAADPWAIHVSSIRMMLKTSPRVSVRLREPSSSIAPLPGFGMAEIGLSDLSFRWIDNFPRQNRGTFPFNLKVSGRY